MRRRLFGAALGTALALAVAGTVFADSCANLSREPAACGWNCSGPVVEGNWVWLPSIGVPAYAWGFAPPGSDASTGAGLPGANGNYTNGATDSLLGMSAYCTKGVNTDRTHGIVSGCL